MTMKDSPSKRSKHAHLPQGRNGWHPHRWHREATREGQHSHHSRIQNRQGRTGGRDRHSEGRRDHRREGEDRHPRLHRRPHPFHPHGREEPHDPRPLQDEIPRRGRRACQCQAH